MRDPREVLTRPAPAAPVTVVYGDHPDQIADVWFPERPSGPVPLVVFVHGGFWRAAYDRTHARPLANDLAARGYAVATIEYRRTGQPGGAWPGTFDDVARAFEAVPDLVRQSPHAPEIGDVVLAGHSAGGHLVLWGANLHRLPEDAPWRRSEPLPIAGVLALAPVADLADAYRHELGERAVAALLGGGPDDFPARYAAADPAALPVPEVPTVLVHGALDDRVPVAQSQRYAARGDARLVELSEVEHFGVIDPLSDAWPAVLEALGKLAAPALSEG